MGWVSKKYGKTRAAAPAAPPPEFKGSKRQDGESKDAYRYRQLRGRFKAELEKNKSFNAGPTNPIQSKKHGSTGSWKSKKHGSVLSTNMAKGAS